MVTFLIIRLSSIGDIFHTLTILPEIKYKFPDSKIEWLVDKNFENIALLSPLIDEVISIPLRSWKKNKLTWVFKLLKYKSGLSQKKYDYIIDTQGLIKSALIARYLFNGKIYGLDRKSAREPLASLFYDYKFNVSQKNIAVIRFKELIGKILEIKADKYKINLPILFKDCNVNDSKIVLFLHGTSKTSKKWDISNWLTLAKWIIKDSEANIYLTYSNDEEFEFTEEFKSRLSNDRVIIINKLEFNMLADLINKSCLIIGVDTGFTHLANLLNKPTLAIYLDSDPGYVGIIESQIAHNFGGLKQNVTPLQLIEYIKEYNLL